MAFSHTWTSNTGNMYFHYGDGSSQGATTLVGGYGDGTKYGQVLYLDTGNNGGVGFTLNWYPVAFTSGVNWGDGNGNRDIYCRVTTTNPNEGCTNSSSNAIYMSALSGGGYGCTNTSQVFKPGTRYYIYLNRGYGYAGGYHHYARGTDSVTWGSATITFRNDLLYTLNVNAGANTTVTVERTSSPTGGGSIGAIANGATIYLNDVLRVTYGVVDGFKLSTHTVNGSSFTSGNTITVSSNVSVVSAATVDSYTLSTEIGHGALVTITRIASPLANAAIGTLTNGSTIYGNDELKIDINYDGDYQPSETLINNTSFSSGYIHIVDGDVAIRVTAQKDLLEYYACYVGNGTKFVKQRQYISDGTTDTAYVLNIDKGGDY